MAVTEQCQQAMLNKFFLKQWKRRPSFLVFAHFITYMYIYGKLTYNMASSHINFILQVTGRMILPLTKGPLSPNCPLIIMKNTLSAR